MGSEKIVQYIDLDMVINQYNRLTEELVEAINENFIRLGITKVNIVGKAIGRFEVTFEYEGSYHVLSGDLSKLIRDVKVFGTPDYKTVDPDGLWS